MKRNLGQPKRDNHHVIEAFTALAPRYERVVDQELSAFWGWRYDRFIDTLLEKTPIKAGDHVLDLATGTAAIPLKLAQSVPAPGHIVGLDLTVNMLFHARRQNNGQMGEISLTCASATALPFRTESFDIITCGLATHHIGASLLLSEIGRVLKKGGKVTIADVSIAAFLRWPILRQLIRAATFLYFSLEGTARAFSEVEAIANVHTEEEWTQLMTGYGFEQIRYETLPSKYAWMPAPFILTARARSPR